MLRQTLANAFGSADPRVLQANVGLWLDKMLFAEVPSSEVAGPHLRKVVGAPVPEGYDLAYRARRAGFDALCEGEEALLFEAKTSSRLVVGLGAKGVLESGITLDRTWGVPYLPGSALKGLCAAAANRLAEDPAWQRPAGWPEAAPAAGAELTDYQVLFGTTQNAGVVRFHDAWWIPGVATALPLAADVMTVHHPDYYQRTPETAVAPTDFDEPVPVPFLSVASASFLVAIEGPAVWCEAARELLRIALEDLGIGAKTSSGYGRLTLDALEPESVKARRAAHAALQNRLRSYRPGEKDAAVAAVIAALHAGVRAGDVAGVLRGVDKGHRAGLLDATRARLGDEATALLDPVIAVVTQPVPPPPPVAAPAETPASAANGVGAVHVRARYLPDPQSPKRFFVEIEGEKKPRKGHTIDLEEGLVESMKADAGWHDVVLQNSGQKARLKRP